MLCFVVVVAISLAGQYAPAPCVVDIMGVKASPVVDIMGVTKTVVRMKTTRQCVCQNCPAGLGSGDCDNCPCATGYNFPAPKNPIVRNPPVGPSRPIPAATFEIQETFEQANTFEVARKGKRSGGGGFKLFRLKKASACGPGGCG